MTGHPDQSFRSTFTKEELSAWAGKQFPYQTWTPSQIRFMHWLATPEGQRHPRTQKALAQEMGFSEYTLSSWKSLPGFAEEVGKLVRSAIRADTFPNILHSLVKKAEAGDVPSARLVFQLLGLLPPRSSRRRAREPVHVQIVHAGQADQGPASRFRA